jgi:hypothetical protein
MALTPQQLAALKADILADPVLAAFPMTSDGAYEIAVAYNLPSSTTVWRTDVSADEIGNAWVGTDIDGMSALNMQRLQLLLASSPQGLFNMSRIDRRAGFENPFGTNVNNASRVAMRAVWKRLATRLEKLFATGTGTEASPATMTFEGSIGYTDVIEARQLP